MAANTTVVFIPGSFAKPSFYESTLAKLKEEGIEAIIVPLLTVEKKDYAPTVSDDAAHIQKAVKGVLDGGKDVLLVAHSYSGIPASMSIEGLSKEARERDGKANGILGIVYAACVVPPVGTSLAEYLAMPLDNPMIIMEDENWAHMDPEIAAQVTFVGVSREEGLELAKNFGAHSLVSYTNPLTYAGYKDVHVTWILPLQDIVVPVEVQQKSIDTIEKESGKKVQVFKLETGHAVFIPDPKMGVEVIKKVVGL